MSTHQEQRSATLATAPDAPDGLMRAKTICTLLDCSDRTLRRWVAYGKFPPPDRKIGRTLRWRSSTVDCFIRGDTT